MKNEYERYFDGISPELQAELDKMTPEEKEASLEEERRKCAEMKEWQLTARKKAVLLCSKLKSCISVYLFRYALFLYLKGDAFMKNKKLVVAVLAFVLSGISLFCSCASTERMKKNMDSEFNGGLNRELIVYSATGEEVWRFSGKFDIEYVSGRILFDDENGKRHTIYFQNGTVVVNET